MIMERMSSMVNKKVKDSKMRFHLVIEKETKKEVMELIINQKYKSLSEFIRQAIEDKLNKEKEVKKIE